MRPPSAGAPESVDLTGNGDGLPATVNVVEEVGADAYLYCTAELGGQQRNIIVRVVGRGPPACGHTVHLRARPGELHLLSTANWPSTRPTRREEMFSLRIAPRPICSEIISLAISVASVKSDLP